MHSSFASAADEDAAQARAAFLEGTALVQKSQWAEAIEAFERANAIRPHAVTTYNLGACERATGQFTRAYVHFKAALAEPSAAGDNGLPPNLVADAKAFLGELERILVRVAIHVEPQGATLAIDGRPLEPIDSRAAPPLLSPSRRAGPGELPPTERFTVLLDPGAHVFVFARKGFSNAVVSRTFRPGDNTEVGVSLDLLPATLRIDSNRPHAVISVDGVDVGPAPVELKRRPGAHDILVRERGFTPYVTRVSLLPGEETRLDAPLIPEKPSLLSRWWFWTAAGVVVAGAAVTTYALTRPDPRRPEVSGGTLGWSVGAP